MQPDASHDRRAARFDPAELVDLFAADHPQAGDLDPRRTGLQ
jgi:hypothetical protein